MVIFADEMTKIDYSPAVGLLLLLLFLFKPIVMAQNVRHEAVAGQFYPADRDSLLRQVGKCFEEGGGRQATGRRPLALIVPHAGYVFSGSVAASAYACLPDSADYDHVFLIGPSHHVSFDGASVANVFDAYRTPLGLVPVDRALCDSLLRADTCFTCRPAAHAREHCLEVQLPFLQYRLRRMPPIVPVIVGTQSLATLQKIAAALKPYFNSRNLFVISSDFSHYPSYADALTVDGCSGKALETGRLDKFIGALQHNSALGVHNLYTSACGQCAIAVLLLLAEDEATGGLAKGLTMHHTGYRNSGDSPYGGKDEVVGYHGFCLTAPPLAPSPSRGGGDNTDKRSIDSNQETHQPLPTGGGGDRGGAFTLSPDDKLQLLRVAWNAITPARLHKEVTPTHVFGRKVGVFVTLTKDGRLRGCIGHFGEDVPLGRLTDRMARAAAFEDPRFTPLREEELPGIGIEISVLTPLRRISDISQFHYGREGIYMRKGRRSGTFLPQVADETGWTKEEFLGHCAQDKAGIGWDGWRTAELFTYEAIRFDNHVH